MSIWEARTSQLRRRMQISGREALFAEALQGLEGSRYRRHRSRIFEGESLRRLGDQQVDQLGEGGNRDAFKSRSLRNNWQPTGANKEGSSLKLNGDQDHRQSLAPVRSVEAGESFRMAEPVRVKRRYRSLYKEAKLGLDESAETTLSHRVGKSKEEGLLQRLPEEQESSQTTPGPEERDAEQQVAFSWQGRPHTRLAIAGRNLTLVSPWAFLTSYTSNRH